MGLVIITALRSEDPSAAGFLHSFLTVAGYSLNGTAAVFCLYRQIAKGWIMGSDSDFPVVKDCIAELKKYGVPVEAKVMSAHRTPGLASEFASKAKAEGFGVIICAAGMAAHLAGVIAGHTTLPVIGIPIRSSFEGLDALLATVQMPSGIPVATVAVNGAKNAAVLAVQMLALSDEELSAKLEKSKKDMIDGVIAKNEKLQKMVDEL